MNFQRGMRRRDEPEVSLIPLIDVVLIIIIFLMVTTTFSQVAGLEITLPSADGETVEAQEREIVVAVTAAGAVVVEGETLVAAEINEISRLLARVAETRELEPVIVIHADAQAQHQRVIDVMQAAQRAGLPQITFAIQNDDGAP